MSCIIENGFKLGCATIGGIEKVWIGTYDGTVTYDLTTTPGKATALVSNANAIKVYDFEQDYEYAGLGQTGQFSRENGTVFYESVLSLKFIELDVKLRNLVLALGKAPLFAVVKAMSGQYFILGVETSGRATEGVLSLGTANGDMNGGTLSITWKSQGGAYVTDATILNFTGTPDATKITVEATT